MICCRILGSIKFYAATERSVNFKKGAGLYLGDSFDYKSDFKKLSESEIIRIHEWLSRYINLRIHKSPNDNAIEAKAHARAIIRNIDTMEANKNDTTRD